MLMMVAQLGVQIVDGAPCLAEPEDALAMQLASGRHDAAENDAFGFLPAEDRGVGLLDIFRGVVRPCRARLRRRSVRSVSQLGRRDDACVVVRASKVRSHLHIPVREVGVREEGKTGVRAAEHGGGVVGHGCGYGCCSREG